jgi:cobalt-zinc-cadmium efflux system outer membrane protein
VLRQALFQYNAMNMGVFQLLRAKRSHVEALQARVMAERDYWVARIALEQILAGRLVDAPELSGAMPMGGNEGGGH